jgi:Tol biopolymer transport system component
VVSPDGSQVVFLTADTQSKQLYYMRSENREIWLMRADGDGARKLIDGGPDFFSAPAWAPDGKHIAYVRTRYSVGMPWIRNRVEILDTASGQINEVVETPGLGSTVAWTPGGRLIYSIEEPPPNQNDSNLWALQLDSAGRVRGSATRLTHGTGLADLVSVTSDGKRLAFFRQTIEPDVYLTDLEANGTKLSPPRRLTLDERANYPYSWTPDSTSVIFVSDRNGTFDIFKQRLDDSEPEVLVRGRENKSVARLTPDGKSVLYLVVPTSATSTPDQTRLMRASLAGGPPQTVLEAAGLGNHQCARSPATTCIFSVIEPGTERFFKFDPEKGAGPEIPGAAIKSLNKFDFNWTLAPDGKTLAMTGRGGDKKGPAIRLFLLQNETERTIAMPGWTGISSLDWAADSKSL